MENLTITEIQARCDALAKAMGEKGVSMASVHLQINSDSKLNVLLWSNISKPAFRDGREYSMTFPNFEAAAAFIAALPDPATEGERKFTRALADAVDIATEYALDDKLVAPVKVVIAQVNEALLAAPK